MRNGTNKKCLDTCTQKEVTIFDLEEDAHDAQNLICAQPNYPKCTLNVLNM